MIRKIFIAASLLLFIILGSCKDDLQEGIYDRPDWLAGKVYDQILAQPDLSTFAKCIELIGFDKIINVSGSYTIFAPSDEAWTLFFQEHPEYSSVEDIPISELNKIVKYHIVQNPWSKKQLRSLDVFGWIDTLDITNDKPRGFKRETYLLEENKKYGIAFQGSGANADVKIVDTLNSSFNRINVTDSRKYAPIFFKEYLDIYDLKNSDYEFYFNRSFGSSEDLYFADAKVTSDEIFAENGFIYILDRVVEPLGTAYEILENKENQYQYTDFLDLFNLFPNFEYNQTKTLEQPGAEEGLEVDSLFDLTYPNLVFDINNEKTSARKGEVGLPENVTIRYHHGLMAPTNEAFSNFINSYLNIPEGWQSINGAPDHIKRIIARSHMSFNPIYPTDFEEGFYNGQQDIVRLDASKIVDKKFGSNATFIGLNEAVVPRAFSSVTGPIYLKQGFKKIMYAIEAAGLLPALKRENKSYSLFVESDANTNIDSSFFYMGDRFVAVEIIGGGFFEYVPLSTNDIRNLILNHVALRNPYGTARKEFIPNMAGNYLIFNNETGEVSGTARTTFGFRGGISEPNYPTEINFNTDNGITYEIDNWFSFTTSDIYTVVSLRNPEFHKLLVNAGLANEKEFRYTFISNNEFYTVFAPSDSAVLAEDFSGLSQEELKNLLLLHFVRGEMIFTDGSSSSGYFTTERIDESSTSYTTYNTRIYIEPDIDVIKIRNNGGGNFIEIPESASVNRLAGVTIDDEDVEEVFPSMYNNGVIHEIDKVLKVNELDTN